MKLTGHPRAGGLSETQLTDAVRGTLEKRITKIFQYVAKDTLTLLVSVKRPHVIQTNME